MADQRSAEPILVKCRHGIAMRAGTDPILECEDCALDDALCEFSERVTGKPTVVYICSNPDCRAVWATDPQRHCPACARLTPDGQAGWSTMRTEVRDVPCEGCNGTRKVMARVQYRDARGCRMEERPCPLCKDEPSWVDDSRCGHGGGCCCPKNDIR